MKRKEFKLTKYLGSHLSNLVFEHVGTQGEKANSFLRHDLLDPQVRMVEKNQQGFMTCKIFCSATEG
jgi:hypothetical protein